MMVLALALLPAAAFAQDRDPPAPAAEVKACQISHPQHAARETEALRPKLLAQAPLASQYHLVLRKQDGCEVPVQIRQDVGRIQR